MKIDIGLKQILLYIRHTQQNLRQHLALKVQHILKYMPHIHKTEIILVFHVLKFFQMLKPSVVNLTLFILHNTLIFLEHPQNGFNMHTGNPNPQSMINEYISGKIVLDNSDNKFIFPALNLQIILLQSITMHI